MKNPRIYAKVNAAGELVIRALDATERAEVTLQDWTANGLARTLRQLGVPPTPAAKLAAGIMKKNPSAVVSRTGRNASRKVVQRATAPKKAAPKKATSKKAAPKKATSKKAPPWARGRR